MPVVFGGAWNGSAVVCSCPIIKIAQSSALPSFERGLRYNDRDSEWIFSTLAAIQSTYNLVPLDLAKRLQHGMVAHWRLKHRRPHVERFIPQITVRKTRSIELRNHSFTARSDSPRSSRQTHAIFVSIDTRDPFDLVTNVYVATDNMAAQLRDRMAFAAGLLWSLKIGKSTVPRDPS